MTNPLATAAQRIVEDRALALLARPELERARAVVTMLWTNAVAWPLRDQADRFANMLDEYMFHHAFRAANGDSGNPLVASFMKPPHHWFGRDVPGSRWGGDSPDFVYRTIPIAHGGRYEIRGQTTCAVPPMTTYSQMGDNTAAPAVYSVLDSLDMDIEADGSFLITVDASPADGRRNHIRTQPGSDFIMVRDALGDWLNQSANALTVTRLDGAAEEKSLEAVARHAAKIAVDGVYYTFYTTQSGNGQPPNQIRAPASSGTFGGMPTQWGTKGNLVLDDDKALIVRCNDAGARFRNVTLTDAFHMSIEYWRRTSSFNHIQMAADEDGDFTFVVAHRDPGVHNWLDTGGLHRVIFGQRWQAFDRGSGPQTPRMSARLVQFDALARELPDGVALIDAAGRTQQCAARDAGFRRRYVEAPAARG